MVESSAKVLTMSDSEYFGAERGIKTPIFPATRTATRSGVNVFRVAREQDDEPVILAISMPVLPNYKHLKLV